jgi:hypothetical protein
MKNVVCSDVRSHGVHAHTLLALVHLEGASKDGCNGFGIMRVDDERSTFQFVGRSGKLAENQYAS